MRNLQELCRLCANDEITSITVCDETDGMTQQFGWLEDVLDWYGNREIHPLFTDTEPDENGYMEITLTAV